MKRIILLVIIVIIGLGSIYANQIYKHVNDRSVYVERVMFALELSKNIDNDIKTAVTETAKCNECKISKIDISKNGSFTLYGSNPENIIKLKRIQTNEGSKWSCLSFPTNYNHGVGGCKSANE